MNPRMRNLRRFYLSLSKKSADEPFLYYENNAEGTTITTYKYLGNSTNVVIPSTIDGKTVTEIGVFTFAGMTNIQFVTIPNTVTKIE